MRVYIIKTYSDFLKRHHRVEYVRDSLSSTYFSIVTKPLDLDYNRLTPDTIPVVINNFNRFCGLKQTIDWLKDSRYKVLIIILDNCSTYPPLLDYYQTLQYCPDVRIEYLKKNYGTQMILPYSKKLKKFNHYIVTDADLQPCALHPDEIFTKMKEVLNMYPQYNHVGASLEIEDIPEHYPLKRKVQEWEAQHWQKKLNSCYIANVDTTFAMYRKSSNARIRVSALRLDRPFTFKHMDWYINPENMPEEYLYYIKSSNQYATWATELRKGIRFSKKSTDQ